MTSKTSLNDIWTDIGTIRDSMNKTNIQVARIEQDTIYCKKELDSVSLKVDKIHNSVIENKISIAKIAGWGAAGGFFINVLILLISQITV
ncbi:MAG: hypothetical protein Q8O68_00830 [Candidatus Daviesbacteria bacterium]|nr:hypothetical protein [Candidatus Daviesbacteria bacterium]